MKLYTRDEIKLMLEGMGTHTEESVEYFLDEMTPIELPTDDEIENGCKDFYKKMSPNNPANNLEIIFWNYSAKWVIDKIKNQQ